MKHISEKKENDYLLKKTLEAIRDKSYKILKMKKGQKPSDYLRELAYKKEVKDILGW